MEMKRKEKREKEKLSLMKQEAVCLLSQYICLQFNRLLGVPLFLQNVFKTGGFLFNNNPETYKGSLVTTSHNLF